MSAYGCIGEMRARARARVRSIAFTRKKKRTEPNRINAYARKQKQKPSGESCGKISDLFRVRPIRKKMNPSFVYLQSCRFYFLFVSTVKNAQFSNVFPLFVCVCLLLH